MYNTLNNITRYATRPGTKSKSRTHASQKDIFQNMYFEKFEADFEIRQFNVTLDNLVRTRLKITFQLDILVFLHKMNFVKEVQI